MKLILALVLLTSVLMSAGTQANDAKKVLIVVSNQIHMGDAEQHDARNNLWEVAPPFHVFLAHDFEVDFVSPNGGKVEFMMDPLGISQYAIKYEGFLDRANASLRPSQVNASDYWGVYVGGGYGTLFDVANNELMQGIFRDIYEQGGIVGSAGHGAGAFANVQLKSGEFLVKGKRIAGFPDETETVKSWAKQGTLLPFLVEAQLNKRGAKAQNKQTLSDKHQVVIDKRIVTTMFLPSAALVAKEMILVHNLNARIAKGHL